MAPDRHEGAAVISHDAAGLAAIGRAAVSLAVWRRPPPEPLVRLLDPLPPEALPHLRLEDVPVARADNALAAALPTRSRSLAPLLDDVARLAELYGRVTGRNSLRLRLERVTDDACRRFHADNIRLRLLCTYRGPGTEWLPADLAHPMPDGGIAEPVPAAIRRLGRFEVGLLKGIAWTGSQSCLHRSPPIAGTGTARLVLCLDEGSYC